MTLVWLFILLAIVGSQVATVYGPTGRRAAAPTLWGGLIGAALGAAIAAAIGNTDLLGPLAVAGFGAGGAVGELVVAVRCAPPANGPRVALGVEVGVRDYLSDAARLALRAAPVLALGAAVVVAVLVRLPARHSGSGSIAGWFAVAATVTVLVAWVCVETCLRIAVNRPLHAADAAELRRINAERGKGLATFAATVPAYSALSVILTLAYASDVLLQSNPAPYPADARLAGFAILAVCGTALIAIAALIVMGHTSTRRHYRTATAAAR